MRRTIENAELIIMAAERDLGPLSDGQRRDLLTDQTDWHPAAIRAFVAHLRTLSVETATALSDNRKHRRNIFNPQVGRWGERTANTLEALSDKLVAADALGFQTYNPRYVPAIPTRVQYELADYLPEVIAVGMEEYIPAWWSKADGYGPQKWCRRMTWLRVRS